MGLTIHYNLKTDKSEIDDVRSLVRSFHALAKQLPFQEVKDIVEFRDQECGYDNQDDPNRWLKIQAGELVDLAIYNYLKILPLHTVAFTAIPGDGSEPANIGLCRYPEFIQIEEPRQRRLRTNLTGWSWSSFCKTQYASDPSVGGLPNFVRCHLCVISLLDAIQSRSLAKLEVSDEGGYWEHRDVRKLAETVGEWNAMIAAVAGQFKDAVGGLTLEAPITQFPGFEHQEAEGRDKLKKHLS